jgi:hypothetical protein
MHAHTALINTLMSAGFTLARKRQHEIWRCPCGHGQITVHSTGGKGRGDINARKQMARTLRECTALKECA